MGYLVSVKNSDFIYSSIFGLFFLSVTQNTTNIPLTCLVLATMVDSCVVIYWGFIYNGCLSMLSKSAVLFQSSSLMF